MSTHEVAVLSIVGFIAFFFVILYAGSFRMRRAATAFLNAIAEARFDDAHALLTRGFGAAVPKEAFERYLTDHGISHVKRFARSHGDFTIGSRQGTVKPLMVREDDMGFPIQLTLHRQGWSWRVAAIDAHMKAAATRPYEPFASPAPAPRTPDPNRVQVQVHLSYLTACKSNLRLTFYGPLGWTLSTVFPLWGFYTIYHWITLHVEPSIIDVILVVAAVFAAPLYIAIIQYLIRRNKAARKPFTFAFDSLGVHLTYDGGKEFKPWSQVPRVTESVGFMYVFLGPSVAYVIPLESLEKAGCLTAVRELVAKHVVS